MKVKDFMTKNVKFITTSTTLKEAATLMLERDVGSLPVGENDRLVGVITDRDITIRSTAKGQNPQSITVKDVMTPKCLYCFEEDTIEEAASNMGKNKIRRLPVLSQDKRLVGIISLGDISLKGTKQATGEALFAISRKA